jgi:DNA-binding transcriptional ArsR family regulator
MTMTTTSTAQVAAQMFRGLAEPTRVAILMELLAGERRVTDLVEAVGRPQSNVSGHLACLKGCGLVTDRAGPRRQVFYRLANDEVGALLQAAEHLLVSNGHAIELCPGPLMDEGCRVG